MTAAVHVQGYSRPARRRAWLQPVFAGLALVILAPILAALAFTLAMGRPLPWQFHVAWVSPHLAVALVVLGMGALQLTLKKGDRRHRVMGYAWLVLMAFISLSGILIQLEPGHVTVVHIASSVTAVINLILLPLVVWGARTGRRRVHRIAAMTMFGFMLNAGLMAFVPFRAIGLLVFGALH
jgi:uncharacterized membrane protein